MLSIRTKGLDKLLRNLEKRQVQVKKAIAKAKMDLAQQVFTSVVEGSPQWSGNLAANWRLVVGEGVISYQPIGNYDPENWRTTPHYKMGHPLAVGMANAQLANLAAVRWDSKIKIGNAVPYADDIEAGQGPKGGPLRDVNYLYGQIAMVGYAMAKFKTLSNSVKKI